MNNFFIALWKFHLQSFLCQMENKVLFKEMEIGRCKYEDTKCFLSKIYHTVVRKLGLNCLKVECVWKRLVIFGVWWQILLLLVTFFRDFLVKKVVKNLNESWIPTFWTKSLNLALKTLNFYSIFFFSSFQRRFLWKQGTLDDNKHRNLI